MIIVVPMAGRGVRFANMGYEIPKWMIRIFGKIILEFSLSSVSNLPNITGYVFVINKDQMRQYDVRRVLDKFIRTEYVIVEVGTTEGQADTVFRARKYLYGQEVCIINCDNIVDSSLAEWCGKHAQVLPCLDLHKIPVNNPNQKSYAKVDRSDMVVKTAEKNPISHLVIAGVFYFRNFLTYVEAYEAMRSDGARVGGEFFIAPMFNYLKDTRRIEVTRFFDLGEPATVEQFILQQQFLPKEFQFLDRLGIDYSKIGR